MWIQYWWQNIHRFQKAHEIKRTNAQYKLHYTSGSLRHFRAYSRLLLGLPVGNFSCYPSKKETNIHWLFLTQQVRCGDNGELNQRLQAAGSQFDNWSLKTPENSSRPKASQSFTHTKNFPPPLLMTFWSLFIIEKLALGRSQIST